MKLFAFVALLALVASASALRDFVVGNRVPGDHILKQVKIDVDYKVLRVVEHVETIIGDGNNRITRIEAADYKQKDTAALPTIVSGGVGDTHVTVKFTSTRGHGIHYILKVYGRIP